jgi:hypothetical protein
MATQDYAASIQGVSIRVTRLNADGTLANGPGDSYTTSAFMRMSFTPEYEEGDEITEKSANGSICVSYKAPDTLKRITMELAICEPDPELTNLISGGLLLRKNFGTFGEPNRKSIGWSSPNVGDDPAGNGVAIECWSFAVKDGRRASSLPYFHWVFPYAKLRQSGDRVIENGMLANTFEGYGLGNSSFGSGLDERWEFPSATERPYSYARASYAPTGRNGFYTWHGILTAGVEDVARTNDVVTITTDTAHDFAVGEQVTIDGVSVDIDEETFDFDGTYEILSTPTDVTFTYALAGDNVVESEVNGTATVPAGSRDVNDLPDDNTEPDGDNVPGAVDFNADSPIDFVLHSSEDPSA